MPAADLSNPAPRLAGDGPRRCGHAPLVAVLLWLGWTLGSMFARWPDGTPTDVIAWQLAMGSAVWVLWLVETLMRPSAPMLGLHAAGQASLWRQLLASAQSALWLLLPGVGWLALNAQGQPAHWLGLMPLTPLLSPDAALSEALTSVHAALAWLLGLLLFVQTLASAKDAVRSIRRDAAGQATRPLGNSR